MTGRVYAEGGSYQVEFMVTSLQGAQKGKVLSHYKGAASNANMRQAAHRVSDRVYELLTGQKGAFRTRIAYVLYRHGQSHPYQLMTSDYDGYNETAILRSTMPIMTPTWSPDGQRLAYVSFERRTPCIFVQNIQSKQRTKLAAFPGMNSSPSWSPDGSKIAVLNKSDKPGCIKYVDQNGDGVINADDKVKLGNSLPEYLYGANFSMGWKGWDFNMSFQGIGHQLVMFDTARIQPGRRQWGAVPSILLGNYWSKHNTEEENLKAKYPYVTWNNTGNIYAGSDFWLFNGAYFRVKNITLGYTIPANILAKTFVKNLRLYASVTDLPAISNYPKQWDPEVATNSTYISTSYIFGLNVKF